MCFSMKKFSSICLFLLCAIHLMATQLIVTPYAGDEMQQDISLIGKWVFVGDELQLLDKSGNVLASEPVANIRKITFTTGIQDALENVKPNQLLVYPNPTQDILKVSGIEAQTLRVYDVRGRLVHQEKGTEVHVSHLSNGVYILQIGTQVVRFIKQ